MKFAAWMMYGSAALHLAAPAVMGASTGALILAGVGALWAVLAFALAHMTNRDGANRGGGRALGYLCFVLVLAGACVALGQPWGAPEWLAYGFAAFDAAAAATLFGVLWRRPEPA